MQANKKVRTNNNYSRAVIRGNEVSLMNDVVALDLTNNSSLDELNNLPMLTFAKLVNTQIGTIYRCNSMSHLIIRTNPNIEKILNLPALKELYCDNCDLLSQICLQNVKKVHVFNSFLEKLKVLSAQSIFLNNCQRLPMLKLGLHLQELRLHNCNALVDLMNIAIPPLKLLEIINCAHINLKNEMLKADSIIIKHCVNLICVGVSLKAEKLIIDSCDSVAMLRNTYATDCEISRCNSLKQLNNSTFRHLKIAYCGNISLIETNKIDNLVVEWCNSLNRIFVGTTTMSIQIVECITLSQIITNPTSYGAVCSHNLTIRGKNCITSLSNAFLRYLTIENCPNIEYIEAIQGLSKLNIFNCNELIKISNSIVTDSVSVKNCRKLMTIIDIVCTKNVKLINLPKLTSALFIFSPIVSLTINNCWKIVCKFIGTHMKILTLIDTGLVSIVDLNPASIVKINNSKYLENVNRPNATDAIAAIDRRNRSINSIVRLIRRFMTNNIKTYIRNLDIANASCAICFESISANDRFISKCFHLFHEKCILQWLKYKNICPTCNKYGIV